MSVMTALSGVRTDAESVSGTTLARPDSFMLEGWGNPSPLAIELANLRNVDRLRAGIQANLALLVPRCHALDRVLPESVQRHIGYIGSKIHREFTFEFTATELPMREAGHPIDPAPAICHQATVESSETLKEMLRLSHHILCVGGITDTVLQDVLAGVSAVTTIVAANDGEVTTTPSGRRRPATNSFSMWQAIQDEEDLAEIGVFVLGRQAGRADVELLRHRIYAHQRVLVEAGSGVLTWLLAEWDGNATRHGNVFVLSEPPRHFQEPSRRFHLSRDADWPRISVVTVSYNQRAYLEECLRSVLDQRYPNFEYIVVDAGSTDGSVELLRRYEHFFAKLIVEPDRGQSHGLNKGFRLATGDILTWVNSDDMLAPLSLKRAAMAMRATGADLVVGTCKRIGGGDGHLLFKHHAALPMLRVERLCLSNLLDWCNSWEKGDWFFQPEVFFSRAIWERAGGYLKLHLFWAMDWEFWLRCALAGATIVRIPSILGVSREHSAQKTTSEEMYLWQIVGVLHEYDDMLAALEAHVAQYKRLS